MVVKFFDRLQTERKMFLFHKLSGNIKNKYKTIRLI